MNRWQPNLIDTIIRRARGAGWGLVFVGCTAALCQTPPPEPESSGSLSGVNDDSQAMASELREFADPTIIRRRLWLDTEWNKYKDGSDTVEATLGALWAWGVSPTQDLGVRLKVPYKWSLAGDSNSGSNENGPGDLKLGTGTAFRLSESWRAAVGLELRMPTAADNLGDGDWRLQEFGALAWDATPWLTLSPSAEYNHSIAEPGDAAVQNYLELYFPATVLLPRHWAVTASYEPKIDFENGNDVTQSAKLQVAKRFSDPALGFALSIKKPFDGGSKRFQVNFVISYYFH